VNIAPSASGSDAPQAQSQAPFIIDGVIHGYNFLESNMVSSEASMDVFREGVYHHHKMFSPSDGSGNLTSSEFNHDWSADELAKTVFNESQADMAVYHSVPMYEFWKDGSSAIAKGLEMKAKHPGRVLVYGSVNPLRGREALLDAERQIDELGVDGIKLYPATFYGGKVIGWRMDDTTYLFPLFERLLALGINNVAVHKAMPLGPSSIHPFKVDDMAGAAARFPDMNFQIIHGGYAFVEETALLLHKFPNIHVNLEATTAYAMNRPRVFAKALGEFLYWGSIEQIIFASGCVLTHPQACIDAVLNFEMPKDLTEQYAYPQVSEEDIALILGGNLARMHAIDIAAQRLKTANDEFAVAQRQAGGILPPWSGIRSATAGGS
jgi:hypothetical protein